MRKKAFTPQIRIKKNFHSGRLGRGVCFAAFLGLIGAAVSHEVCGQAVSAYESCTMVCTLATQTRPLIAIRSFLLDRRRHFLLVDPIKLTTSIQKATEVKPCSTSWIELRRQYVPDPYIKALFDAETTGAALQDAGINHFNARGRGIGLTVDLCPSKRRLDRAFFTELIKTLRTNESPVPLAIAITGLWIKEHGDDFCWLKDLADRGRISITWINHSYRHRIGRDLNLSSSFLLKKGTRLKDEILKTEELLIRHGALPSVFFRFPGLVSSDSLVKKVVSYGLFPVGSDAWLAKNQRPTDGSIVLVHANGNEPAGLKRFFKLLKNEKRNIDTRQWILFDLKESVVETEEETYEEPRDKTPGGDLCVLPAHGPLCDVIEDLDILE